MYECVPLHVCVCVCMCVCVCVCVCARARMRAHTCTHFYCTVSVSPSSVSLRLNSWGVTVMMRLFFIHISSILIYVMSCVRLFGSPASCHGKNFNAGLYMQTVLPIFFIPAILMGTIDVYPFILTLVTLTMSESHMVSAKQNILASFSHTLFILSG